MSVTDSPLPAEWFLRAEQDFEAARHLLEDPGPNFSIPASVLLQQAVEKYLKGFLLAHGKKLRRTHDLLELLDEAILVTPELGRFDALCIKITEYYSEQRYPPLVSSELSREEVLLALVEAEELIVLIKRNVD